MGNQSCCGSKSHAPVDLMKNMEELYDPFSELKSKIVTDENIVRKHAPTYANFMNNMPHEIVKK